MSLAALTLYPPATGASPDSTELAGLLAELGLIGAPCGPQTYLAGKRFFDHITFLGCSPRLALRPEAGDDHLRIELFALATPRLFASANAHTPLCPECRQALADWRTVIAQSKNGQMNCGHCGAVIPIDVLNFRRRACYARTLVRISPVFESEAIPTETLLDSIEDRLAMRLRYAYT